MSATFVYCATCGAANPPDAATCFACGNPPLGTDQHAPTSSQPTTLLASQTLLRQRYRLLAQIGTGGFGAVYQAEDTELGNRKVAIKEMSQRGLTPEELQEAIQNFRQEALLLAGLTHPHLPRIYEQFSEGGKPFLVMDFIEGETLEARLSRMPGGRLPVQEVLRIGVQLCAVLDYLHTRQPPIIFRDLKPANIMITQSGDIYLIDFGIARHFKPGQTRDTVAFGSAGYAAPEQYGKAQTTTRSDIYSLGATLHHLLSGNDPSNSPFLFAPLQLAEPAGLEALIMQMLETDQSKRPASMAVIKQALERMARELEAGQKQQRPVVAPPPVISSAPAPMPLIAPRPPPIQSAVVPLLLYSGHTDRVNSVSWSPDGRYIASGGNDLSVQIWESASGKQLWAFPETDWVHMLAWSPDGEQLAWVSKGKVVHLWQAGTGDFSRLSLPRQSFLKGLWSKGFLSLAWSPDSSCLAAGGLGQTVEVWEVKTGKHLLSYAGHRRLFEDSVVYAVAWSPDGEWIASAGTDVTIQVWEAATCYLRCTHLGYRLGYLERRGAIAWSPDGRYIASVGEKATIHIWDAATGQQHLIFRGHTGAVNEVAWSPDGRYLASAGSDHMVRVWNIAAAGRPFAYFHHSAAVNTVAWSPDGTRLASAGDGQTVQIWKVK